MHPFFLRIVVFASIVFLISCTKQELVVVPDNDAPLVNNVPRIKIESYVNRVFIDLLGREPLDEEMTLEVNTLKDARLSEIVRINLITKLQTGTDFIVGDTSYQRAYYQNLYNLAKIRCLEGASDRKLREFSLGDDVERVNAVLATRIDLQEENIQLHQAFARMVNNPVYDIINMNSFNFVNATFDNLLWRHSFWSNRPRQSQLYPNHYRIERDV